MSFTITITEQREGPATTATEAVGVEVFRQTVEQIDMHRVFAAVNVRRRARKAKGETK